MTDSPGYVPAHDAGGPGHGTTHGTCAGHDAAPARPGGRRPGPVVMLASGLAVIVPATVMLVLGLAGMIRADTPLATVPDDGSTMTSLEAGTTYGLFGSDSSTCTVVGPDGAGIQVQDPTALAVIPNHNLIGFFTPGTDGEHTVTCSAVLPVRPTTVDLLDKANASLEAALGISLGVLGLVVGLSLVVAGRIRRRNAQARPRGEDLTGSGGGRGTKGDTGPHIVLTCGIAHMVLGNAMFVVGFSGVELFRDEAHGDLRFAVLEQSLVIMMRLGVVATILGALVAVLGAFLSVVRTWVGHRAITRAQRAAQQPHVPPVPTGPHGRRGPTTTLVSGLVATGVALVMVLAGFSLLTRLVESTPQVPGDGVPRPVALEEGTPYWLQSDVPWHASPCAVTGPDGAEVPIRKDRAFLFATGILTPTTSGTHTITCTDSKPVRVGRLDDLDALRATAAGTVAGGLGLVVGLSSALAGLIWLRVRASRSRTSAPARLSA